MFGRDAAHGDTAGDFLVAEAEHNGCDNINTADEERIVHEVVVEGGAVKTSRVERGGELDVDFGRKGSLKVFDEGRFIDGLGARRSRGSKILVRDIKEASEVHFGEAGVIIACAAGRNSRVSADEKVVAETGGDFDEIINLAIKEGVANRIRVICGQVDDIIIRREVIDEGFRDSLFGVMVNNTEVRFDGFEGDGRLVRLETEDAEDDKDGGIHQNHPFIAREDSEEGFKDGHIAPF